jgi:hypothetical protein
VAELDYNGIRQLDPDDLVVGGYRRRLAVCCYLHKVTLFTQNKLIDSLCIKIDIAEPIDFRNRLLLIVAYE